MACLIKVTPPNPSSAASPHVIQYNIGSSWGAQLIGTDVDSIAHAHGRMRLSPWKHLDLNGLVLLDSPSPQLHKNSTVTTTQTSPGPTSATWSPENEYFFWRFVEKRWKKEDPQAQAVFARLRKASYAELQWVSSFAKVLFRSRPLSVSAGEKKWHLMGQGLWLSSITLLNAPAISCLCPHHPGVDAFRTKAKWQRAWNHTNCGLAVIVEERWERMGKDGERWKRTFSD